MAENKIVLDKRKLVERYINGKLYWLWNEHKMTEKQAEEVLRLIQEIEDGLDKLKVTDKDKERFLKYADLLFSLRWFQMTDASTTHIMKLVFTNE
jgi:hypothetical protein